MRARSNSVWTWLLVAALIAVAAGVPARAAGEQAVTDRINALAIDGTAKPGIISGLLEGVQAGRVSADGVVAFVDLLDRSNASATDMQAILSTIASTFLSDLPGQKLMLEVQEGIQRGLTSAVISGELTKLRAAFAEVKARLLDQKGITVQNGYAQTAVDEATIVITEAILSHADPNDGALLASVLGALRRDPLIPDAMFSALSQSLSEGELAQVAAAIAD